MSDAIVGILVGGFIVGFFLAFSMGANDVANAFGTSFGSKVLTFKHVCILATIFEISGSVLLGGGVSDTISKGMVDMELYVDNVPQLLYGYLSALFGASGWLLIATVFKLPVSGTHSIVGAVLGFTLVANGTDGVRWLTLIKVVSSWFTSPLLSGAVSSLLYVTVKFFVLRKEDRMAAGRRILPILYGCILAINAYMALNEAFKTFNVSRDVVPIWGIILIAIGIGIVCWGIVYKFVMPWISRKVDERMIAEVRRPPTPLMQHRRNSKNGTVTVDIAPPAIEEAVAPEATEMCDFGTPANLTRLATHRSKQDLANLKAEIAEAELTIIEPPEICHLFAFVQVVTACFAAFSHGGNDVSNAVAPIIGLYHIYETGEIASKARASWWILLYGGAGMSVGLCLLGRRVLETIGTDLTSISPVSGFCIDLGAALTVLLASHIGVPVSTTHCLVGSLVCVSLVRMRKGVDWRVARNIAFSWAVTVPVSCGLSALCMFVLKSIFESLGTFDDWQSPY